MTKKKSERQSEKFRTVIVLPPTTDICEYEIIYWWYDKETHRFYYVLFDDKGDLVGGYSYLKGRKDPCKIICRQKRVVIPGVCPIYYSHLKEDEEDVA